MTYKRTKHDSPLKCPYCGKQFTMNGRRLGYKYGEMNITFCKGCGEMFYYRDMSGKYARENQVRATFRKEEVHDKNHKRNIERRI